MAPADQAQLAAAAGAPSELHSYAIAAVCQYCEVAFHQFRPSYTCNRCVVQVCQFCSWHNTTAAYCKLCQPELKTDQQSFSFRQFLWAVKLLPFSCRADKWFYFARKRRSPICSSSVSREQYAELLEQLHATNMNAGSGQQRMIDQDVERTFHQLHDVITDTQHLAFQQPTRNAFKKKTPLSDADFAAWRVSTRELLSAFLLLKPQIGYCQGMTHLAAVIVQEAKLNCEAAFRLFLCMTEKYRMDLLYGPEMRDVNLRFFQLDETLRRHLRPLHTHLSDLDVHPTTYASSWILTLFTDCRVLPHRCVLHFLDLFFREGWKAFFKVTLMIFVDAKAEIMKQQTAEDVLTVLAAFQRILHAEYEKDVSKFITAASAFKIRNSFLDALELEFWSQRSLCE